MFQTQRGNQRRAPGTFSGSSPPGTSGPGGDGPAQVLHLQPEVCARPRDPPVGVCGALRGVWFHGRQLPQGDPAQRHQDADVGRTGEALPSATNV